MDRSPSEYVDAAGHVAYELDQLVQTSRWLQDTTLPTAVHNACLESMLVHARSLTHFLVVARDRSSDLHRDNFAGAWSPTPSEATARLLATLPVANKHLAHLTWERITQGQQPWEYPNIAADVVRVFSEFLAEAKTYGRPGVLILESALARAAQAF